MRLGIFEVHRLRKNRATGYRELPWDVLTQEMSQSARAVVAKVARSEVKNYLAEQAERAEMPFSTVAEFLREVTRLGNEGKQP